MKKLLFCNLHYDLPECARSGKGNEYLPMGLGIIMDIASKSKISFDYFDTYLEGDTNDFFSYYEENKQDVILFSAILGNYAYKFLDLVFKKIKHINPLATIVLGGPITNVYPEILMEELPVDICVIGEGEDTFLELLEADFSPSNLGSIQGIAYRNRSNISINPPRPPLPNPLETKSCNPLFAAKCLEQMITNYAHQQKELKRGWEISASRGCVGKCTFCARIFDKPIRFFSPEYNISVIKKIIGKYGLKRFNFIDENFIGNRKNLKRFLDILEEDRINIKWRVRGRIDNIPFELLDRMQRLGLYSITIGIESASQEILDSYNKHVHIENYIENLKGAARRKLLYAAFIVGSPLESKDTIRQNVELIRYLGITRDRLEVNILQPVPGTKLFEDLVSDGTIRSRREGLLNYRGFFKEVDLNISGLSNSELLRGMQQMFETAEQNGLS